MKHVLSKIVLLIALGFSASASANTEMYSDEGVIEDPAVYFGYAYNLVCSDNTFEKLSAKEIYINDYTDGKMYSSVYSSPKYVKYNKSSNTYTVKYVYYIHRLTNDNFEPMESNIGYINVIAEFDFKNMRFRVHKGTGYTCSGKLLGTINEPPKWMKIIRDPFLDKTIKVIKLSNQNKSK